MFFPYRGMKFTFGPALGPVQLIRTEASTSDELRHEPDVSVAYISGVKSPQFHRTHSWCGTEINLSFGLYRMSHSLPNTALKIFQRNLNRSTFVVWEMKRNVSVVRLIVATRSSGPPASGKIIKEMPGSVVSGTPYIMNVGQLFISTCERSLWR